MKQLPTDYIFSDEHNKNITNYLHLDYREFQRQILSLLSNGRFLPNEFRNFCNDRKSTDQYENPYVLMKNCPVDLELPYLNLDSPVIDKRNRKITYVSEGFLLLYANLMDQEPIGYINVNDGNIFQDIHPMRSLMETQSQKAANTIYFHKDLANHFVRPDWVNILGLRASPENEIYTSFVRNKDLIEYLDASVLAQMKETRFNTPYDDLTLSSSNKKLSHAPNHPILGGAADYDIRFFENRTVGVDLEAQEIVNEIKRALHVLKKRLLILKGDFIGSANNECIHNKEVVKITDEAAATNRWLMKTVNVKDLEAHSGHMLEDEVRLVNG